MILLYFGKIFSSVSVKSLVERIHTGKIYDQLFHSCYFVLIRGYIFSGLSGLGNNISKKLTAQKIFPV